MPAPKTIIKSTNQKQTKTNKTKNKNPSKLTLQQIKELESQIKLSQHQDLNPISDLINVLIDVNLPTSPLTYELIHTTLYALHRIFSTLIRQGRIHTAPISNHSEEALKVVTEWLKERYDEYTSCLLNLLKDNHEYEQLSLDGLTILMSLVRAESELSTSLSIQHSKENPGKDLKVPLGGFQSFTFKKLVKTFLIGSGEKDQEAVRKEVKVEFILRYFNYCDDIRYHFLKDAAVICQRYNPSPINNQKDSSEPIEVDPQTSRSIVQNLLQYLEALTTMPTEPEELNQFWTGEPPVISKKRKPKKAPKPNKKQKISNDGSTGIFDNSSDESEEEEEKVKEKVEKLHPLLHLRSHQKVFSECWISILSLGLVESEIKRVLNILHHQVIPHMPDPKILMDFLVDCTDLGGTLAILALNGLFTLMSKHNLDYPAFYTRLYALLDGTVLHVRHRPRFFRMLNTFLSSTHLPVNIVASFMKKLARLSLFAPPGAIITIIPFCYNLIKQHPSCMSMLHRQGVSTSVNPENDDPFDINEPDPLRSGAIFSSLWELSGLRSHYLSSISTLSKVFSEAFDKPKYDLEDFLDHTYKTLFDTELNRQIRKPPALSLFATSFKLDKTSDGLEVDDIVSQIWKF